jgi:hypothetical protein
LIQFSKSELETSVRSDTAARPSAPPAAPILVSPRMVQDAPGTLAEVFRHGFLSLAAVREPPALNSVSVNNVPGTYAERKGSRSWGCLYETGAHTAVGQAPLNAFYKMESCSAKPSPPRAHSCSPIEGIVSKRAGSFYRCAEATN